MQDTAADTRQKWIAGFILTALAAILGAWGFEVIGRYEPCALCLQQRLPYYTAIPLAVMAMLLNRTKSYRHLAVWLMLASAAAMGVGAGLGVYHAGIEWQFWAGPSGCSAAGGFGEGSSVLPDLSRRVVPCNEAALRIFGISLAGYNALIAAALTVIALIAAWQQNPDEKSSPRR